MVASFVQLNTGSGGAKAQTVQNTIGGNVVDANAIVLHDTTGLPKDDYATLFYDAWSVSPIDTTDKWTTTGTAPTIASGVMTMPATVSTYNAIQTKDTIRPNVGYTLVRNGIALETSAAVGAGRFWGLGTPASVPAAAVLAQNGIGYEIDQATGALLAVTYAAGARTTVATLTRPADGANHAYGLFFRVTQAIWVLDGVTVASQSFPNVLVAELPALIVRQNAASFTGTPVFTNIAHLTADTSRQSTVIADPVVGTRQARVDATGALKVTASDPTPVTFWTGGSFTPAATPSNMIRIAGSATKTVRIKKITLQAIATTAGAMTFTFVRRSAADTGGTFAALSATPMDSTDVAATATVGNYTANPTALGASVGAGHGVVFMPFPLAANAVAPVVFDFATRGAKPITLRGTAESFTVHGNTTAVPAGGSIAYSVEWTET